MRVQARRRETFSFCAVPSQRISRMNRILTRLSGGTRLKMEVGEGGGETKGIGKEGKYYIEGKESEV